MNKENEKELRKHLELQTKEELIEQIIILTRTYENALNTIVDKKDIIDKAIEYIHNHQLVFELSSKEQIQEWFDEFYKELLEILRGEDND